MAERKIYVVTGSEDGVIMARTSAQEAIRDALDYIGETRPSADRVSRLKANLRREGHTTVRRANDYVTADVETFIDE